MFKYNNTHIFTGYLKQLLSSVNIPTCKIYTREFAQHFERTGKEDPRVIESFDTLGPNRLDLRVNYLKDNELYSYFWKCSTAEKNLGYENNYWKRVSTVFYDSENFVPGLTKTLHSPGRFYDTNTHEYLGEYLRFLRDYHNVNLMSLYNCFNNKICNNINTVFSLNPSAAEKNKVNITVNSQDSKYRLYAIPVKLFENYTIAIDCHQGIELFCGLYNTNIEKTNKTQDLFTKTYKKISKTVFSQPIIYDKLDVKYWSFNEASSHLIDTDEKTGISLDSNAITRWDIINREKDLKLFIRVPVSCKSSIVVLEGNYINYNNFKFSPSEASAKEQWYYAQNRTILNFGSKEDASKIDLNTVTFNLINKLQLLAFNTGESYPFADRLVEYLSNSAITSIDAIPDNIKRAQQVMNQNGHYFSIEGLWEDKMQKIIYDYVINSGPFDISEDGKTIIDKHHGYNKVLGHTNKSSLYDVLGYIDREAEKWYASWTVEAGKPKVKNSIGSVDIYEGLYDI